MFYYLAILAASVEEEVPSFTVTYVPRLGEGSQGGFHPPREGEGEGVTRTETVIRIQSE